jgi:hypothetical protein
VQHQQHEQPQQRQQPQQHQQSQQPQQHQQHQQPQRQQCGQQSQSNIERQSFAITQIINIPKVNTLMARKSPRIAESQEIKAESQVKEEDDPSFIGLKVKQQVLLFISIKFHCMSNTCRMVPSCISE